MMATAVAKDAEAEALARNAVALWKARRRRQAADQYLAVIAQDPRWRDELALIASDHHWPITMIEMARRILQYLYAASLRDGTYPRITSHPDRMGGAPTIRGMRLPVITIARMAAGGASEQDILDLYPDLEPEDIREALEYAAQNPLIVGPQV